MMIIRMIKNMITKIKMKTIKTIARAKKSPICPTIITPKIQYSSD
jgi:hypothetical protein